MPVLPKISKQRLVKLIDDLEKSPNDKLRILGDVGIVSMFVGVGTPVASVAAVAGVTSLFGLPAAAHLFGWMAVLGGGLSFAWLIAVATVLGLLAFSVTRLIYGGGLAEGRKAELLGKYRDDVKTIEARERSGSVTEVDRARFILSLRELIDANAIPIGSAFRMIEMVEAGRMPLSQAVSLTKDCLETKLPKQFPW